MFNLKHLIYYLFFYGEEPIALSFTMSKKVRVSEHHTEKNSHQQYNHENWFPSACSCGEETIPVP